VIGERGGGPKWWGIEGLIGKLVAATRFPGMAAWIEMFFVKVKAVCEETAWMESCFCHPVPAHEVRLPGSRRRPEAERHVCPWAGRRVVEITMGRPDAAIANILSAGSGTLNRRLAACSPDVRSGIIAAMNTMTTTTTEEWEAKFTYRDSYPTKFLRVMCPYFAGTIEESIRAYSAALEWYDALDNKDICPECLAMFLRPGALRDSAEEYIRAKTTPLHMWWDLFKELLIAAAMLLVERRLEGQHSIIGGHGKQSLNN
jgi:hypothetical protein